MEKKIKDLTDKEVMKICINVDYCCEGSCKLFGTSKCVCFNDKRLEEEIEVE